MWDGNGHATGRLAPGGYIVSTDPEGKTWELWSAGYRNPYDFGFNADGEIFAYDADMEWDFGMPWYRPTRVNHATSGSELGWRSGTAKWPAAYPDSLPALADIGPGSPVGAAFGYGAKIPANVSESFLYLRLDIRDHVRHSPDAVWINIYSRERRICCAECTSPDRYDNQ